VTGGAPRRAAEPAPIRDEVRAALPAILARHALGTDLAHAFALPGGRREKYVLRLRGERTPLVLRIYAAEEAAALENGLVATRSLEARGSVPVGHCCGFAAPGALAPFGYRLHEMLWGADLERLLQAGALAGGDFAAAGRALGEALAALHELCAEGFGEPRREPHERERRLSAAVRAEVERLAAPAEAVALLARAAPLLDAPHARPRLAHGRFGPAAVLVRREGGRFVTAGVLGLDDARFFDPAWDLVALEEDVFARAPALREPFEEAYAARMRALPACEPERRALYRAMRGAMR
jgi:aminoglycoside phosphotransferase (APT) family kinase protein